MVDPFRDRSCASIAIPIPPPHQNRKKYEAHTVIVGNDSDLKIQDLKSPRKTTRGTREVPLTWLQNATENGASNGFKNKMDASNNVLQYCSPCSIPWFIHVYPHLSIYCNIYMHILIGGFTPP